MPDIFTREKRSEVMSKIRSKNTKVELLVFRELRKRKIYFQKHYKRVQGSPDVALPRKKIAVFIDGGFWHGYRYASLKKRLKKKFWRDKIEGNMRRDARNRFRLKREGWRILRVWDHDLLKKRENTIERIAAFILSK